jgi:hypothetical protein
MGDEILIQCSKENKDTKKMSHQSKHITNYIQTIEKKSVTNGNDFNNAESPNDPSTTAASSASAEDVVTQTQCDSVASPEANATGTQSVPDCLQNQPVADPGLSSTVGDLPDKNGVYFFCMSRGILCFFFCHKFHLFFEVANFKFVSIGRHSKDLLGSSIMYNVAEKRHITISFLGFCHVVFISPNISF